VDPGDKGPAEPVPSESTPKDPLAGFPKIRVRGVLKRRARRQEDRSPPPRDKQDDRPPRA
jgi:hypothetical protein